MSKYKNLKSNLQNKTDPILFIVYINYSENVCVNSYCLPFMTFCSLSLNLKLG